MPEKIQNTLEKSQDKIEKKEQNTLEIKESISDVSSKKDSKPLKTEGETSDKPQAVGALLRAARLAKKQDLRDISSYLCIRYQFLEALEQGNYQDLPGEAYANGFVRSYAAYLGLDSLELMSLYKQEFFAQTHLNDRKMMLRDEDMENVAPAPKLLIFSLLLILLTFGFWQGFSENKNQDKEIIKEQLEESQRQEILIRPDMISEDKGAKNVPTPPVPPLKPTYKEKTSFIEKKEVSSLKEDKKEDLELIEIESPSFEINPTTQQALEDTVNLVSDSYIEPENLNIQTQEEPQVSQTSSASVAPIVPPEPKVYGLQNAEARLILKATETVWVEVTRDNKVIFTRLMNQGDEYYVPVFQAQELLLQTGNAGGLDVYLDNQRVSSLGRSGQVRSRISLLPQDYVVQEQGVAREEDVIEND